MGPDQEARASQLLSAMAGVIDLLHGRVPGLQVDAEEIAAILSLIHGEAVQVVPDGTPKHRRAANDEDQDE